VISLFVLFNEYNILIENVRASTNGSIQFRLWDMRIQSQREVGIKEKPLSNTVLKFDKHWDSVSCAT